MSKLITDEYPLLIPPSLAVKIGLNQAIFVQQLHYLLPKAITVHDDKKWVYKTLAEWIEQFPFFSVRTFQRVTADLVKKEIVLVCKLSKNKSNQTNYYALNYSHLQALINFNTEQDDDVNAKFAKFFDAYLRKNSKAQAKIAFVALNPDDEHFKKIMDALILQNKIKYASTDPKYIPFASTWLKGKLWLDEIPSESTTEEYEGNVNAGFPQQTAELSQAELDENAAFMASLGQDPQDSEPST